MTDTVSDIFDPNAWRVVPGFDFDDITYHRAKDHGTVRIAFDRPEIRNAFRPATVDELHREPRLLALGADRWLAVAVGGLAEAVFPVAHPSGARRRA